MMTANTRWARLAWWLLFANAVWCTYGIHFTSLTFAPPALVSLVVADLLNRWINTTTARRDKDHTADQSYTRY